jgi:predicted RNA-binding Zn-ribbon protein involved in translation (DUF1610 family)
MINTALTVKHNVCIFFIDKLNDLAPKKKYNHQCEECGKQLTHLVQFKSHLKQHRPLTTISDEKYMKSRFKCPLCQHKEICNKLLVHYDFKSL